MTSENVKNFLKLVSDEKSDWLEKANWRKENRDWLHNSQRIAIRILGELRKTEMSKENLAKNIGVSVKYINEILKGQKNLTLKNISKLEKGLGVKLIDIDIDIEITKHRYFVDIRCGCGAVRDRFHESYNKDYPGLHRDTPDVVEYKHGYTANGIWNMKDDDVTYLNELCNRLNIENINYDNRQNVNCIKRIELKKGIIIEGFEDFPDWKNLVDLRNEMAGVYALIYQGKTSDITEVLAKECVELEYFGEYWEGMWEYSGYQNFDINKPYDYVNTAKESILSACSSEYCIIYRNKE